MADLQQKTTYTAAEVAVLEETIRKQETEIAELKRKLEHMNEVFANAQRARFGQSSEKETYVLGKDQLSLFDEAESAQDHKAEEPKPDTIFVAGHERKKKRTQAQMLNHLPEEEVLLEIPLQKRLSIYAIKHYLSFFEQYKEEVQEYLERIVKDKNYGKTY